MEKPKRKSLSTLSEALKQIRRLPPDPKIVEKFNNLVRKDEEAEKHQPADENKKRIARDPEVEV